MNDVLGLYARGDSVLHRLGPGTKILGLGVITTIMMWQATLPVVGGFALFTVLLVALAGVGWSRWLAQLRPLSWMLLLIGALQWYTADLRTATVTVLALVVAVGLAGLLTLTTRTEALMDAVITGLRPLRRVGVNPEQIALLFALTLRAIPTLARVLSEADEARIARGASRSVRALAVPATVRTLRYADQLGEALIARGLED